MFRRRSAAALLPLLALGACIGPSPAPAPAAGGRPAPSEYDVRILRDSWGVPHVFGVRDADTAYGLAWAHAEDDFHTIQISLLASRGELAREAGAQRLAPFHFSPRYGGREQELFDEAASAFGGPILRLPAGPASGA